MQIFQSLKILLFGILISLFAVTPTWAAEFTKDQHYAVLSQPQPVDAEKKIEVRELFWYGCPHCFNLEPILNAWIKKKPKDVAFVRTPAVLRKDWAPLARAFYTFEALGVTNQLHGKLFDAIHLRKQHLNSANSIADFAAKNGIDRDKFLNTYKSFGVDSAFRKAQILGRKYEADGVPTIIVDGRYRTTATMAGSHEQLMQVVDFLVNKSRASKK
ncbi:MAG TPA: thiol:disulfide interchange protein DsbA/DsbL [Acidiferrobacteraceae bacterium]|nr:thiol:disulfide interchange protein DsbA/DsbL [Acidiferrobacteraceae bacterium]